MRVDLIQRDPISESLAKFARRGAAVATYHDNATEQVVSITYISNDILAIYYRQKDVKGG